MNTFLFAMAPVAPKDLLIVVLAAGCVAGLVALLFRKDREQEARLRGYGDVAAWAREAKLQHVAAIFQALNVKDFSGLAKELLHLVKLLNDPKARETILDDNFAWQLDRKLKDPVWFQKIADDVSGQRAANASAAARFPGQASPADPATPAAK